MSRGVALVASKPGRAQVFFCLRVGICHRITLHLCQFGTGAARAIRPCPSRICFGRLCCVAGCLDSGAGPGWRRQAGCGNRGLHAEDWHVRCGYASTVCRERCGWRSAAGRHFVFGYDRYTVVLIGACRPQFQRQVQCKGGATGWRGREWGGIGGLCNNHWWNSLRY